MAMWACRLRLARHAWALAFLAAFLAAQVGAETAGSQSEAALADAAAAREWSGKRTMTAQGKTRGPGGNFNCRCAGKVDQRGQGDKCERWGFRTTWCYVEAGCTDDAAVSATGMPGMKKLWACHTFKNNPSNEVKLEFTKVTMGKNAEKKDKKKLEEALKEHTQETGLVKHQDDIEDYAEMKIQKEQSVLNKWGAVEAKTAKFPATGKDFEDAQQEVKDKMDHARHALNVAKSVLKFAKFKKIVNQKKADDLQVQIEHIREKLKMSHGKLVKEEANAALQKASEMNKEEFSWKAQKRAWEKQEGERRLRKAKIVLSAAKEGHEAAINKYGKGTHQEMEAKMGIQAAEIPCKR